MRRWLGRAARITGRYLYLGLASFGASMFGGVVLQETMRGLAEYRRSWDAPASHGPSGAGHPERAAGHLPPTAEERDLWARLY
jgi:hypothetical protein